jgi:hypothetical protein
MNRLASLNISKSPENVLAILGMFDVLVAEKIQVQTGVLKKASKHRIKNLIFIN